MKIKTVITSILIASLTLTSAWGGERNSFKDRTEKWTQPSGTLRSSRGLDDVPDNSDDPTFQTPIQDARGLVFVLSGIYLASCVWKNRKRNLWVK